MKTIAILPKSANLVAALVAHLAAKYPNADLKPVAKVADAGPDAVLANVGLPSFIVPSGRTELISVNTKFVQDPAEREAQNAIMRDPDSSPEEIQKCLANINEFVIFPKAMLEALKSEVVGARSDLLEHVTDGRPEAITGDADSEATQAAWDSKAAALEKKYRDALVAMSKAVIG